MSFSASVRNQILLQHLRRLDQSNVESAEIIMILYETAKKLNAQTIIELGVGGGHSSLAFLAACAKTGGHLWSADIQPCFRARKTILDFHLSKFWTFIQQDSLKLARTLMIPAKADIIFIDTNHQYEQTRKEILFYEPFLRNDGVMLLHDSRNPGCPGVEQAIKWILQNHPAMFRYKEYKVRYGLVELTKIS